MTSYAGDVDSRRAFQAMEHDPEARLVDVRTRQEWNSVGVPDVPGVVFVEWTGPDGTRNDGFLAELDANGISPAHPVYFLCRSGQRSRQAALIATSAGYRRSYNVSDGFEGPSDASGRRTVSGWKNNDLPWRPLP